MRPVMHVHGILDAGYYLFSQECVTFLGKIKVDDELEPHNLRPPFLNWK
jgi:hypothetical protein